MTRKILVKVFDEDCECSIPFLKWVTDIVNATPAEFLDALNIRAWSNYETEMAYVEVSYERDETPEEVAAAVAAQAAEAEASRLWTIEREKSALRALKAKYPND